MTDKTVKLWEKNRFRIYKSSSLQKKFTHKHSLANNPTLTQTYNPLPSPFLYNLNEQAWSGDFYPIHLLQLNFCRLFRIINLFLFNLILIIDIVSQKRFFNFQPLWNFHTCSYFPNYINFLVFWFIFILISWSFKYIL